MARPRYGHLYGHKFFDNAMADGVVFVDEIDLTASEATWHMVRNSRATEAVTQFMEAAGDGEHEIPRRFIQPFEISTAAEATPFSRTLGRTSLNTVTCPECGLGETRLRRWFMGSESVWWCDPCHRVVPTLRLVAS